MPSPDTVRITDSQLERLDNVRIAIVGAVLVFILILIII